MRLSDSRKSLELAHHLLSGPRTMICITSVLKHTICGNNYHDTKNASSDERRKDKLTNFL